MQNNLDYKKGGKYPQQFCEKLAKTSLNTDAISSMVLQDKKIAEVISELPASKEAGFRRKQSKNTGFEPTGSLFSCLSG